MKHETEKKFTFSIRATIKFTTGAERRCLVFNKVKETKPHHPSSSLFYTDSPVHYRITFKILLIVYKSLHSLTSHLIRSSFTCWKCPVHVKEMTGGLFLSSVNAFKTYFYISVYSVFIYFSSNFLDFLLIFITICSPHQCLFTGLWTHMPDFMKALWCKICLLFKVTYK